MYLMEMAKMNIHIMIVVFSNVHVCTFVLILGMLRYVKVTVKFAHK